MDPAQLPAVIELSRFSVSFNRRELLAEDRPLDFGGRTFDHLVVQTSGAVVSKDALRVVSGPIGSSRRRTLRPRSRRSVGPWGGPRSDPRNPRARYQFIGDPHGLGDAPPHDHAIPPAP